MCHPLPSQPGTPSFSLPICLDSSHCSFKDEVVPCPLLPHKPPFLVCEAILAYHLPYFFINPEWKLQIKLFLAFWHFSAPAWNVCELECEPTFSVMPSPG